jgi:hypothetical protein
MTEKGCKALKTGALSNHQSMKEHRLLILSESLITLSENNEWKTYSTPPLPKDLMV